MKYLKFLLILLLIPFIVLAEECDVSKITITSLSQSGIEGHTEVIDDPSFKDRNIKLNLKMYEVGDSITYDMTIKNDSEEDYMIDEDTFKTDSEYIEYVLRTMDNSNVVKAKGTKDLTLTVNYKNAIDVSLLNNNKFDASNTMKLSMNTKEKEKELDIITTEAAKQSVDPVKVSNPITSISSVKLITIILLTTMFIVYLSIRNKKKYGKYFLLIVSLSLITTVYAICKADIELESVIEIYHVPTLNDYMTPSVSNSCITKYEGLVTDEVGKTVNAKNVYFNKCVDNNAIFGGFCWQLIRTTETGGVKMMYNGEPVDGKCESNRSNHKGLTGSNGLRSTLYGEYVYSNDYYYDFDTNEFTLKDTFNDRWGISPNTNLYGKFTCQSQDNTCTTMYAVHSHLAFEFAYVSEYKVSGIKYAIISRNPFNANDHSVSTVGYMYNRIYNAFYRAVGTTEYKYGNDVVYDNSNNKYTLSGTTQNINNWSDGYNQINNTHYTCFNSTGECSTVNYIYKTDSNKAYYITVEKGEKIEDVMNGMLYGDDINKNNSNAKQMVENWYERFLSSYTHMMDDVVYCNDRSIADIGGWDPNGGDTTKKLTFNKYVNTNDLSCTNRKDQFAVSNDKAGLNYPVGLISYEEWYNLGDDTKMKNNRRIEMPYWTLTPLYYDDDASSMGVVYDEGDIRSTKGEYSQGIRPAITLKKGQVILRGKGTKTEPWVIKEYLG